MPTQIRNNPIYRFGFTGQASVDNLRRFYNLRKLWGAQEADQNNSCSDGWSSKRVTAALLIRIQAQLLEPIRWMSASPRPKQGSAN